jgi:hypothetical protein
MKNPYLLARLGASVLLVAIGCGGGSGNVDSGGAGTDGGSPPSTGGILFDGGASGAGGSAGATTVGSTHDAGPTGTGGIVGAGGSLFDGGLGSIDIGASGGSGSNVDGRIGLAESGSTGGSAVDAPVGGTGGSTDGGGLDGADGGSPAPVGNDTCMDILSCIAECPDADQTCPDDCYAQGSEAGQEQLLALLTCMDQAACEDVGCTEAMCDVELTTCLDSSTTGSGTPNPDGGVPAGNVPPELVGHWTSPGSSEVEEFTFNADGTATHSRYKESGLGSCSMSVLSQWNTGSAVVQGDRLTVTLADGATSVAWYGGCGTGYTNPAPGKTLEYTYALDLSRSPTGLWLTDLSCTGQYCETYFHK